MHSWQKIEGSLGIWQEAIWLLIALSTPLFVNLWVEQQFEASKVWLFRPLVWLLVVLWLSRWLAGMPLKPLPPTVRNLALALFLFLLLSTLLSINPHIALFGSLERANGIVTQTSYLLLFWSIATQIDRPRSRQLLYAIIFTAAPICLFGLAQAFGWQPLPIITDARTQITTTLGRANFTGAYLALTLPLTISAALSASGNWRRSGYGGLAIVELIVIALTQARAAWFAALIGVSAFLWFQVAPHLTRRNRWLITSGGIASLGASLSLILRWGIANGGSIAARWTIWKGALPLLWYRLWNGYGADTLELVFPSVYPPQLVYYQGRGVIVDRAHNWLLDWSLNYGIVATIILSAFVFVILRQSWRRLASHQTTKAPLTIGQSDMPMLERPWLAACMASVCAHLAGNLFLFDVAATAALFWLLLALLTASAFTTERRGKQRLPVWGRMGFFGVAFFFWGWLAWRNTMQPLAADYHSWRGTQLISQGQHTVALTEYAQALQRQPRRAPYHVAFALTSAQLGEFRQAEAGMYEAISLRPTDPVLYNQLAGIYALESVENPAKIQMAFDAYEQAINLAPTIGLTYQQYADLALRSGETHLALLQAQRAVDLDATDGVAFGILGWAHLQNGDLPAAQNAFTQAVRWQPDSADFHLGLATAFYQQGELDAARQSLKQSLTLDPDYAPALTFQLQLQER